METMSRLMLVGVVLVLAACAAPAPEDTTVESSGESGGEFVCVTSSYDLTECSPVAE